jgi:tetraacyldisaccharide 4'-kinase
LIEYDNVLKNDLPLPAGNMREPFSSAKRADIIIISKSPAILAPIEKKKITEYLQNYTNKPVFFTYMKYGELTRIFGPQNAIQMGLEYYRDKNFAILLIAGIANPSGLIEYLRRFTDKLEILIFHDHHEFNQKDIQKIQQTFDNIANLNKIIITTEKDSMRLRNPDIDVSVQKLPVFYLPIQVAFHQEEDQFKKIIQNYVRKYKTNSGIYKG